MPGYIASLKALSFEQLACALDAKIAKSYHALIECENVQSVISSTNATGFRFDEYEIDETELLGDECTVKITWKASGEQYLEKPFCGDVISGTALAIIDDDGRVSYWNVEAESNY